jgi:phosphatidylglycerophosphate synthase
MQSSAIPPAPGRPREIEAWTNVRLVHPVSRAVVDVLLATPVTPNQVSLASVACAAAAAACYLSLAWPWAAFAGLACQFAWHVLDGADGDLARRSGRASPLGELIDGICDHLSQVLIYVALVFVLQRDGWGSWASWGVASIAGASHFIQANAYETGRKTYRRWVYGADWMRQTSTAAAGQRAPQRALAGLYMLISDLAAPGEARIETAMGPFLTGDAASTSRVRGLYRDLYASLVKASGLLDSNTRTIALFASILAGSPLWFFLFEITVQNVALIWLRRERRRRDDQLISALGASAQAASAPNWSLARRA